MFGLRATRRNPVENDLGFGSAASNAAERLLNRDGTFNSRREGLGFLRTVHFYDLLLTMSWPRFLLAVALAYLATNVAFATLYLSLGEGALESGLQQVRAASFPGAFFFSVHTLSTVGYGHIVPASNAANILMTLESIFGMFGIALTTGLVFARFARPTAKIMYSEHALIAPYRDGRGLMFRIANQRSTQIIELEATVVFSKMEQENGRLLRKFYPLKLERSKVIFFPLAWTVVHPIDKDSPLFEMTDEECLAADSEILILMKGIDETFSQTVHSRTSYKAKEIVWSAKFADIYLREHDRVVGIDLSRLSEQAPAPPGLAR